MAFEHLPSVSRVEPDPQALLVLFESSNQVHIQLPQHPPQLAHSAVVVVRENRGVKVLVALSLSQSKVNVIYGQPPVAAADAEGALEEGLQFAESMGFMLDNTGWASLDDGHRKDVLARLPCFRSGADERRVSPRQRLKAGDPLAAVARLFAAFGLLLMLSPLACAGASEEQMHRDAELHYEIGTNLLSEGDAQGALREYLASEKSDPDLPQLQNGLGLLNFVSLRRYDEAERHFKRAIALQADFSEALNNLGSLYLDRGRYSEAVPLFEKALANPLYPEADRLGAQVNLGWALFKMGARDKGIARIREALLMQPQYCAGWRNLGEIYEDQHDDAKAEGAYGKYVAACPDQADAHFRQGRVLLRMGRVDDAHSALRKCVSAPKQPLSPLADQCRRLLGSAKP